MKIPYLHQYFDTPEMSGDTFVLVNNANIYDSSTFRRFRARIMEDVVWPNGLTNLYIACYDPASDTEDLQGHIRLTGTVSESERSTFSITFPVVGTFSIEYGTENFDLNEFGRVNGPAIMFPYLRENIASISTRAGLTNDDDIQTRPHCRRAYRTRSNINLLASYLRKKAWT